MPPSLDVSVCEPVSKLMPGPEPVLRVRLKSVRSKPVTISLKLIVMVLTDELRGSGVTSLMTAPGAVLSSDQDSVAFVMSAFVAVSAIPEPLAVSVSVKVPCVFVTLARLPSV